MRIFFGSVAAYAAFSTLVVYFFRDNPAVVLNHAVLFMLGLMASTLLKLLPLLAVIIPIIVVKRRGDLALKLLKALGVLVFCSLFSLSFVMIKSSLPHIAPFWADPMLAEIDRVVHFGVDPWVITHQFQAVISNQFVLYFYHHIWLVPAIFMPVLLFLIDSDTARVSRFVLLWLFVNIGLGNILALIFLSGGPIYYEQITGVDRFDGFTASIHSIGMMKDWLAEFSSLLWDGYDLDAALPPGISAFPSVHLGMACVFILYIWERYRRFWPAAALVLLMYQFFSVYIGWHYAVDGYFSILAVIGIWIWLRKYGSKHRKLSETLRSNVVS